MGSIGNILIIIVALGLQGNVDARPLDGTAQASGVVRRRVRRAKAVNASRPRARKRDEATPPVTSRKGQPAHLAPQPEDVPPVKPPKKALPPADKRNPSR